MKTGFGFIVFLLFVFTCAAVFAADYHEITVTNGGTIRGIVTLKGTPPPAQTIGVSADAGTCGKEKTLSSMIVGPNQGVKNTIVGLQQITAGKKMDCSVHIALDQLKCEYSPHVLIIPKGATVDFVNSDSILHNAHAYHLDTKPDPQLGPKTLFNMALPVKDMKIAKPMEQAGLIRMLCDAGHPWMNAYILVTEHPYFAVTDEMGKFELTNVPAGTYTITMWHEGRGTIESSTKSYKPSEPYRSSQKVTVKPGSVSQVNFTIQIPSETKQAALGKK